MINSCGYCGFENLLIKDRCFHKSGETLQEVDQTKHFPYNFTSAIESIENFNYFNTVTLLPDCCESGSDYSIKFTREFGLCLRWDWDWCALIRNISSFLCVQGQDRGKK